MEFNGIGSYVLSVVSHLDSNGCQNNVQKRMNATKINELPKKQYVVSYEHLKK